MVTSKNGQGLPFPRVLKAKEVKSLQDHAVSSYHDVKNLLETLADCKAKLKREKEKNKKLRSKLKATQTMVIDVKLGITTKEREEANSG
jgi:hypothetical protein|tara:strand:- start:525 stop:791 length:267 start_codon:yes stop_codon:yes gene_type:complete